MGRPPVTTHAALETVGIELFTTHGFERTSVDDIAEAAGVSRRTFFRYFPAKADVVWGDFDRAVEALRAHLATMPADVDLMEALRRAVVRFNHLEPEQRAHHRRRMVLILEVPDIVARSTLRFTTWRQAIAEFAAQRLGQDPSDLLPRTIGYSCLGAAMACYEQWLVDADADLDELFEQAFAALARGFDDEVARSGA